MAAKTDKKTEVTVEQTKALVSETARATLSISPTEAGWSCYFLLQKHKIEKPTHAELIQAIYTTIVSNRTDRVVKEDSKKKGADKPYVLNIK